MTAGCLSCGHLGEQNVCVVNPKCAVCGKSDFMIWSESDDIDEAVTQLMDFMDARIKRIDEKKADTA